jgi:hypothetical protein
MGPREWSVYLNSLWRKAKDSPEGYRFFLKEVNRARYTNGYTVTHDKKKDQWSVQ